MRNAKSRFFLAAVLWLGALAGDSRALDRQPFSMEVLVDGRPLSEHAARGTTYVEAITEAEYTVRLRNGTGHRVAVALSVDGLNSIDALHTTAREASKWILGPYETITIDGWQTSSETARRFFFTTEERSYGSWLGQTDHLGRISAAFFNERRPRPIAFEKRDQRGRREPSPSSPPSAEAKGAADTETGAQRLDDMAATGIGRELDHRVRRVEFQAEDRPAAQLSLRYEYRDALVRLGVLPVPGDPLARRERSRGFDDLGFAPDPFRVRRR